MLCIRIYLFTHLQFYIYSTSRSWAWGTSRRALRGPGLGLRSLTIASLWCMRKWWKGKAQDLDSQERLRLFYSRGTTCQYLRNGGKTAQFSFLIDPSVRKSLSNRIWITSFIIQASSPRSCSGITKRGSSSFFTYLKTILKFSLLVPTSKNTCCHESQWILFFSWRPVLEARSLFKLFSPVDCQRSLLYLTVVGPEAS